MTNKITTTEFHKIITKHRLDKNEAISMALSHFDQLSYHTQYHLLVYLFEEFE